MDDNPHHDGGRYADCRKALEEQVFQYRSLSSIARKYLPLAMDMHERGEPWGRIARKLKVSKTSLYNWRRIRVKAITSLPGRTWASCQRSSLSRF